MEKKPSAAPVLPWMRVPVEITADSVVCVENVGCLDTRLQEALQSGGISGLFPVQTVAWRELAGGYNTTHDMCIAAPTGSGKTLSYALPVVQGLCQPHRTSQTRPHYIQALVVLPTRDLASQVHAVFEPLCKAVGLKLALIAAQDTPVIEAQVLTGEEGVEFSGVDIVVATPGRLMAHIHGTPGVTLQYLKFLVVDEADRLLRQSYQEWLPQVLARLPPPQPQDAAALGLLPYGIRRTVKIVVSATLTRDPSKLARLDLTCPRYVAMTGNDHRYKLPKTLQESRITVAGADKPLALLVLLRELAGQPTLVFTSSLTTTHKLFLLLEAASASLPERVVEYSSMLSTKQRMANLELFKTGGARVLVASDAMTRGMDLESVSAVINYDAPVYAKTYVHRAGRTARAGRGGRVLTLLRPQDSRHFKAMLRKADNNFVAQRRMEAAQMEAMRPALQDALKEVTELLAAEAEEEAQHAQHRPTQAAQHPGGRAGLSGPGTSKHTKAGGKPPTAAAAGVAAAHKAAGQGTNGTAHAKGHAAPNADVAPDTRAGSAGMSEDGGSTKKSKGGKKGAERMEGVAVGARGDAELEVGGMEAGAGDGKRKRPKQRRDDGGEEGEEEEAGASTWLVGGHMLGGQQAGQGPDERVSKKKRRREEGGEPGREAEAGGAAGLKQTSRGGIPSEVVEPAGEGIGKQKNKRKRDDGGEGEAVATVAPKKTGSEDGRRAGSAVGEESASKPKKKKRRRDGDGESAFGMVHPAAATAVEPAVDEEQQGAHDGVGNGRERRKKTKGGSLPLGGPTDGRLRIEPGVAGLPSAGDRRKDKRQQAWR